MREPRALEQLVAQLTKDCKSQSGPWAIKDPRSSLLLPLWKSACASLNIPLNLLLAVRDPAEVSVSLTRRDKALTGMSHWRAQRLCWHHNASVLRDGCDLPLEEVSYSQWLDPERARNQLERLAPHCSDEIRRKPSTQFDRNTGAASQLPVPCVVTRRCKGCTHASTTLRNGLLSNRSSHRASGWSSG